MADVELVIKIPEEVYERFGYEYRDEAAISKYTNDIILDAFCNGTPLHKGHGRIGDLDELKKDMQNYLDDCEKTSVYTRLGFETAIAVVEDAKTLIEADKEQTDG